MQINNIKNFPIKTNSINVSAHVAKVDIKDVNLAIAAACKACDEGLLRALQINWNFRRFQLRYSWFNILVKNKKRLFHK